MHFVPALESLGNCVQSGIATALRLDFGDSGQYVVPVCPGSAMPLAYQMDLALEIKASGILGVAAIDQEHHRHYIARWCRCERDPTQGFEVDGGHLLAFAQIRDGGIAVRRRHPIGDAAAGAAAVEAEHKAGLFRGAAMNEGVDTQRPVQTDEPRGDSFEVRKAWPPHQRPIAEYPKIFVGGRLRKVHEDQVAVWRGRKLR